MAQSVLAKMAVQISANTAEFSKAMTATQKQLKGFETGITKIASTLGIAFGAQQVTQFIGEISRLAGEFQGVSVAFDKLENSKKLLLDLKSATGGAVSELNLMKRAVQFSNFGLDIKELPTLLEFATIRAQQTGQSVDYLVDSIVTGLGRKSILILDNLGISAVQLREEMAKVGDITVAATNIINRDLEKMGEVIQTNVTKTERLSAEWENFKIQLGKVSNDTNLLGGSLDALATSLVVLGSDTLSAGDKLAFFSSGPAVQAAIVAEHFGNKVKEASEQARVHAHAVSEAQRAYKEFNGDLKAFTAAANPANKSTKLIVEEFKKLIAAQKEQKTLEGTLQGAMEEQAVLQKQKLTLTGNDLIQTNIRLKQLDEEIKRLNSLGIAQDKVNKSKADAMNFLAPEIESTNLDTPGLFGPGGVDPFFQSALEKLEQFGQQWTEEANAIAESSSEAFKKTGEAIEVELTGPISSGIAVCSFVFASCSFHHKLIVKVHFFALMILAFITSVIMLLEDDCIGISPFMTRVV